MYARIILIVAHFYRSLRKKLTFWPRCAYAALSSDSVLVTPGYLIGAAKRLKVTMFLKFLCFFRILGFLGGCGGAGEVVRRMLDKGL